MTDQTNTPVDGSDFNFGFENFRPMGFTFDGIVVSSRIEKPKKDTYTFKIGDREITKEAKPQLVLLVKPTDHDTKSGNPYPEYFPLTHNGRSKLGLLIQSLNELGIKLGNDPTVIEGKEFRFEMKEVDFGQKDLTRVMVPVGLVDDLTRHTYVPAAAAVPAADRFDGIDLTAVAAALDGADKSGALVAVTTKVRDPRVIAGMADGSLTQHLIDEGLVVEQGGVYVSRVAARV